MKGADGAAGYQSIGQDMKEDPLDLAPKEGTWFRQAPREGTWEYHSFDRGKGSKTETTQDGAVQPPLEEVLSRPIDASKQMRWLDFNGEVGGHSARHAHQLPTHPSNRGTSAATDIHIAGVEALHTGTAHTHAVVATR